MNRKTIFALFAIGLAACASATQDPPRDETVAKDIARLVERRERRQGLISVDFDDADLSSVVAHISSLTGQRVQAGEGVHERVSITLRGISWRDAIGVIAKLAQCEVEEDDGVLFLEQPHFLVVHSDYALRPLLWQLGSYTGDRVLVGSDIARVVSFDYELCDTQHGHFRRLRRRLDAIAREQGLHVAHIGSVVVVATEAVPSRPSSAIAPDCYQIIEAWGAPAGPWFELMASYLGKRVEAAEARGAVDCLMWAVPWDDAIAAAAAANGHTVATDHDTLRITGGRAPKVTAPAATSVDLPRGGKLDVSVEAIAYVASGPSRALLSGRVYATGEALFDAMQRPTEVHVARIEPDAVTLAVGSSEVVCRPQR